MAQIIKHRRGTLANLSGVNLNNGEIGVVTSSVANIGDAALKSALVVGHTDGTNRLPVSRLSYGTSVPNLGGITGGANFNDLIHYDSDNYKLYRLNSGGNTDLDLTGALAGRAITGSLEITGNLTVGGNLTLGDAATDSISFAADVTSDIVPNASDTYNLGSDSQRWDTLYLSGSISASGGPHIIESTTTNIFNSTTTTAITATTTLTAKGNAGATFGDDTGTWEFDGSGALSETGMTTISMTPSSTVDVDAGGAVTIDSSAAAISIGGDSVAQKITVGGDTGTRTEVELNAILVDINAGASGITIDAGATSNFTTSAGDIDINAAANLDLDGATIDIDSAGALSLQGGAASDLTTGAGAITVDGKIGVDIKEDGTSVITIDTNRDTLFASTGGATGDPDVEFDGYVRHDGQVEVANTTTSTTNSTGALVVDGGVGIVENLNVGGNASITGNLTVSGTTTTVDSTVVNIGDNIITLNAAGAAVDSGIQVIDAVSTAHTGSLLWNATNDYWYSGISGSTHYRHPVQAGLSDLTENRPVIVDGSGRLESSANITDDGSTVNMGVSTHVTGSVFVSTGASVASGSSVAFQVPSSTQVGYMSSADTTAVTAGLIGYNASNGNLTVSSVIDGGSF
tara:strand:+ start:131 stop:2020 length:1890 start_codon:yes stop_codon:yes gene_type:complete